MKAIRTATALLAVAPLALAAQSPIRVGNLTVSEPVQIAELDMDKLKGQPFRLAWSPDGSQLYVQTLEGSFADANAGKPSAKLRHYLFDASAVSSKKDLNAPPDWFAAYWNGKNGQHPVDAPGLRIEPKTEQRRAQATAAPSGGDLAKGGEQGASVSNIQSSTGSVSVPVTTLVYKGEKIGEFVNSPMVPGLTYGWGPSGTNVIAFAEPKDGEILIMDDQANKLKVEKTKGALLPAWAPDGARLAWIQKDGKKKYKLFVSTISRT